LTRTSAAHTTALFAACRNGEWAEFWADLAVRIVTFEDLGLTVDAPDVEIWEICQREQLVLITGNRNSEHGASLEYSIRTRGTQDPSPVLTLADPERLLHDRAYAERTAASLLERLTEIEALRGSGRIYLP
jgi:hypothetical protein